MYVGGVKRYASYVSYVCTVLYLGMQVDDGVVGGWWYDYDDY